MKMLLCPQMKLLAEMVLALVNYGYSAVVT